MADDPEGASLSSPPPQEDLSSAILYEVVETHICKITINRPHKRNAIVTPDMNEMLAEMLERAQDDDAVKVVILAGKGTDFCAGEDTRRVPVETYGLRKGAARPGQSLRMRGYRKTMESLQKGLVWGDKVVIAACQGAIMGQGFAYAMAADLLILSDDAKLSRRQSRIGFAAFESQMPMTMLKLGPNRAMEILLTGRIVTAAEMKEWGVANSVVPSNLLEEEAMRYARAISMLATDGLMLGKRALQQYYHGLGVGAFQNFATVAHPLFTNLVWREDEYNFLRERNEKGNKQAWRDLNQTFSDLGFE